MFASSLKRLVRWFPRNETWSPVLTLNSKSAPSSLRSSTTRPVPSLRPTTSTPTPRLQSFSVPVVTPRTWRRQRTSPRCPTSVFPTAKEWPSTCVPLLVLMMGAWLIGQCEWGAFDSFEHQHLREFQLARATVAKLTMQPEPSSTLSSTSPPTSPESRYAGLAQHMTMFTDHSVV